MYDLYTCAKHKLYLIQKTSKLSVKIVTTKIKAWMKSYEIKIGGQTHESVIADGDQNFNCNVS